MAARPSIGIYNQIGKESPAGTPATADTILAGLSIKPSYKADTTKYMTPGELFPTGVAHGKAYTEAKIEGSPYYEELDFIFGSALCTANVGAYKPVAGSAFDTYTVAIGDSTQAETFSYGAVTGFTFKWTPKEITISGDMIGKALSTGGAIAEGDLPATLTPVSPGGVTISVGGTKQTKVYSVEWAVTGIRKPDVAIDAAEASFSDLVHVAPEGTVKIVQQCDAAGIAALTRLKGTNAATAVSIACVDGGMSCTIALQTMVDTIDSFDDSDGNYTVSWTGLIVKSGDPISVTLDVTA